jgi:hypothetical protein
VEKSEVFTPESPYTLDDSTACVRPKCGDQWRNVMTNISSKTFDLLLKGFLITSITTIIGLILPGLSAYRAGVFDAEMMAEHVTPSLPPELRSKISDYREAKARAQRSLVLPYDAHGVISVGAFPNVNDICG